MDSATWDTALLVLGAIIPALNLIVLAYILYRMTR